MERDSRKDYRLSIEMLNTDKDRGIPHRCTINLSFRSRDWETIADSGKVHQGVCTARILMEHVPAR